MKVYNRIEINDAINLQCQRNPKMRGIDKLIDRLANNPKSWLVFEDELSYDEVRIMAEWYNWKRGK